MNAQPVGAKREQLAAHSVQLVRWYLKLGGLARMARCLQRAYFALRNLLDPLLDERIDPSEDVESLLELLLRLEHVVRLQALVQLETNTVASRC